jgi:hypothetical protein
MEAGDFPAPETLPVVIGVRGARHNDLRDAAGRRPDRPPAARAGAAGGRVSIIVIDHDLDLLAAADHLIDMGPGGGPGGGRILATGTPEDVARAPGSATGPWLAEHLGLPITGIR